MIILILILSLFLNLYGINWGLPSQTRSQLVFPVAKENEQLFKILKDTRTEPKGNILEYSQIMVNRYGTGRTRPQRLEFFPDRLPHSEPMVGLLRGYLLTGIEPDEQPVIAALSRMDPQRLNFNPHFFTYGGCFIYTVGLALKIASLLDWVTSTHDLSYYFKNPEAMERIYVVGRMVVALSVLLSTFLLYLIGKRLYDRETGLLLHSPSASHRG